MDHNVDIGNRESYVFVYGGGQELWYSFRVFVVFKNIILNSNHQLLI